MHNQADHTTTPTSPTRKHALPRGRFHRQARTRERRERVYKPKRSPLGRHVARVLRGISPHACPRDRSVDAEEVLAEAIGRSVAARIVDAALLADLESAVRERNARCGRAGDRPVAWRPGYKQVERPRFIARLAALTMMILERVGTESKRACSAKLWLGHTYRLDAKGKRRYLRKGHQGGLAARLGVTVRELERYIAILVAAGVIKAWQPMMDKTGRAPVDLPEHLRGEVYAYQVYELQGDIPRELAEALRVFYGKRKAIAQATPAERAELDALASSVEAAAKARRGCESGAADFLGRLARLERATGDPPS